VKTILVADDQPLMRLVVKSMIRSNPAYQVHEAVNGAQALAVAREHRPDLVLLDVEIPEMTGPEVCAILKGSPDTKDIPILLISGGAPGDVHGHMLTTSADGFFAKPFTATALLARLKELLGE